FNGGFFISAFLKII
ncbi:hypothetical protein D046_5909, partial [Vibrio parahaemolyticus V-223/04]